MFRERLADRRALVVLDDAAGDEQVGPGTGCAVLVLGGAPALALLLFSGMTCPLRRSSR